jgi:hypothetical protein
VNFGTPVRLEKQNNILLYSFDLYEDERKQFNSTFRLEDFGERTSEDSKYLQSGSLHRKSDSETKNELRGPSWNPVLQLALHTMWVDWLLKLFILINAQNNLVLSSEIIIDEDLSKQRNTYDRTFSREKAKSIQRQQKSSKNLGSFKFEEEKLETSSSKKNEFVSPEPSIEVFKDNNKERMTNEEYVRFSRSLNRSIDANKVIERISSERQKRVL